jgi:hypothetical protein
MSVLQNLSSNGLPSDKAILVARLDDALALFDEPSWHDLRSALLSPTREAPQPPQPAPATSVGPQEWYAADASRLAREKAALAKLLRPTPEYPGLFYLRRDTKRLGAVGLVQLTKNRQIKLEMIYPGDYPVSPPKVYCFGPGVHSIASKLQGDGAIPVPFGADQQWTPKSTGALVVAWAIEWLEEVAGIQSPPPQPPPVAGVLARQRQRLNNILGRRDDGARR